jgi:CubicO group peptidase (beta-lactamase class C family)
VAMKIFEVFDQRAARHLLLGCGMVWFLPMFRRMAGGILIVMMGAINAGAQRTPAADRAIDKIFASISNHYSPGYAVLVKRDGKTIFQRAYGVRDLRSKLANDAQTNFRLASCTKQFTAMAVMLLVHDGKLKYQDRLTDVFPEFPAYGKAITVRHLLNHTSGLPDYETLMEGGASTWSAEHQITDEEVLKLLQSQKAGVFAPGTKWSYSNSGYVVLGLLVAKVSGQSFPDFLRERIFRPLKMEHTLAYVRGKKEIANRAYGHSKREGDFVENDQSSTSATLGDGGVYSNLEDLSRWDDALASHALLSEKEMRSALTPVKLPDGSLPHWSSGPGDTDPLHGKPVEYGFGWFLDPYSGRQRMWHYGDTVGFQSSIQRFTKDRITIIVLSNRDDMEAAPLALKVADVIFER